MELHNDDYRFLVRLVSQLPVFRLREGREALLLDAGLELLIPRLNLEGESFVVSSRLIQFLSNYGYLDYNHHALGRLVNAIRENAYVGVEGQVELARILVKYALMTPIAAERPASGMAGERLGADAMEAIIGENTLRPVSFLRKGVDASRAVAYLEIPLVRAGTGFLISPCLVLTNHHVLPTKDEARVATYRFNYQDSDAGPPEPFVDYRMREEGIFQASERLDYALIEVEMSDEAARRWGCLPLVSKPPSRGDRVNIIQHPAARPKQISLQNNFVEGVYAEHVQYVTSTMKGSSGSPVFDDDWHVIALHHAGGMIPEPGTGRRFFRNEGILAGAILRDLPVEVRRRLEPDRATT